MATIVYKNAYFWVNGVDYSNDFKELTLNYKAEMLDATVFGLNTRTKKGGLFNWDVQAKAIQNFASAHVGANMFALVGTTTCIELRPQNTCTTVANPSFFGVAILETWTPMMGSVGSLLETPVNFQAAGDLSRASSS